jgi:hypothetical protein
VALVPFPPTNVAFLAACSKPEAFIGNASAPGIPLSTIDQVLREVSDDAAALAFSDRRTLPLLQVDEGFQGLVFAIAGRRLMSTRGYNRQAGADEELVEMAKRADERLGMCGPGAGGKRITYVVVDSAQNVVQDSIRIISNASADWWARNPMGGRQ